MNKISDNIKYFKTNNINGAVFYNPQVKSVNISLMFKSGTSVEPTNRAGLAKLTSNLVDKGSKKLNASQISDKLEILGSFFSSSVNKDVTIFNAWSLEENILKTLEILKQIISEPVFPKSELERESNKFISSLYQIIDSPSLLSKYLFEKNVFKGHPYGNIPTPASVKKITLQDVIDFYQNHYTKNNLFIVYAGNIKKNSAIKYTNKYFNSIKESSSFKKNIPDTPSFNRKKIVFYNKPDSTQAQIRIGFTGVKRNIEDYESVRVMNYILGGGGFSSRLLLKIRSERGLTYSIKSAFNSGKHGGSFVVSTFSKNKTVGKTIELIDKIIEDFIKNGPKKNELKEAISFYSGNIPLSMETPLEVAHRILYINLYSLPDNYIEKQIDEIKSVSIKDIKSVLKKYLDVNDRLISIVGNLKKLKPQIKDYAELEQIKKVF